MTALQLARVFHNTTAEGPGLRTAVWTQGCSIRCPGCINPHLFGDGGTPFDPSQLAEEIVDAGVEGVTLLGGEPFDQAQACSELAALLRTAGLGVITFTGYQYEALQARSDEDRALIAATDLLVDGPYRYSEPEETRALVGSANQRFIHLSDRYASYYPDKNPNRIELRVSPSGETELAGFLTHKRLKTLSQDLMRESRR